MDPLTAIVVSFCILGVMLYKRINLGITLNLTAILLALFVLDWREIPNIIYASVDPLTLEGQLTISVVLATFGIMWLSQLYKETGFIKNLSESLSSIIKNSKIVSSVLPAVIGLLPVAGGALMSAPIVDSEAEKLKLKPEEKAYVNVWFRHIVLPVYPLSLFLIITVALTGTTIASVILRQIPIVTVMIIIGYVIGFWKVSNPKSETENRAKNKPSSEVNAFLKAFSPILATIVAAIFVDVLNYNLSKRGVDVLIATFLGLIVLAVISNSSLKALVNPLRDWVLYDVTCATYGAFLLRNVMNAAGISEIFKPLVTSGSIDTTVLLTVIPTVLGFLMGSPSGGVAISVSMLGGILTFSPKTAALIYMGAYLGYVVAPTHLCFTFTADYFKSPLSRVYKYLIPSFIGTFAAMLFFYFLPF
ncbi:MAG: DUF401 family protein [Candidatus Bathyarchaeales archaeon]